MGDILPQEASEAAPPPYTSIDPAGSNRRIESQLPAVESAGIAFEKNQMREDPHVQAENPLAHQQQQQQHTSKAQDFRTGRRRSSSITSSSSSSSASSASTIKSHDLQGCTPSSIRSSLYALRSDLAENKDLGVAVRQFRDHLKQQTRMMSASDRKERKKAYKQEYRELRKEIKHLVKDAVKETKQERKSRRSEKKRVRKEEKQVRKSERKAAMKD